MKVSEASTNSLKTLAVSAGVISSLTTDAALRGERLRGSPFESLTGNTRETLDKALPGELDYFVGMYGQAATAYLVSNSRSLEEVSGRGVPAALVGIRRHLWSRALRWVHDAFGERRATQRRADVEKLALSLLTGAVPAEPAGKEGEKIIVELLGGSKPHRSAEIEREGGSLSTGTMGTLVGEAAQFSIRVAYRKWAKGLMARCMGEVLLASKGRHTDARDVVGVEGDFGIEEVLLNVSEDLPVERLRSIGRFLLEEVHAACVMHRLEPAAPLPDVAEIVSKMGGEVFLHRRQEHMLETMAQQAAGKLTEALSERLTAVEARQSKGSSTRAEPPTRPPYNAAGGGKANLYDKKRGDDSKNNGKPGAKGAEHTKKGTGKQTRAAGVDMDDATTTPAAKAAAKALEESMQGAQDVKFETRVQAVAALQAEYRRSVGSPEFRRLHEKEPCPWLALAGKCKEKKCRPCASGLSFDDAMVSGIRARCVAGLFSSQVAGGQPARKEPG